MTIDDREGATRAEGRQTRRGKRSATMRRLMGTAGPTLVLVTFVNLWLASVWRTNRGATMLQLPTVAVMERNKLSSQQSGQRIGQGGKHSRSLREETRAGTTISNGPPPATSDVGSIGLRDGPLRNGPPLRFASPRGGRLQMPSASGTGTAIHIDDEENSYCEKGGVAYHHVASHQLNRTSTKGSTNDYKCLVVSADGTSASIKRMSRSQVEGLRRETSPSSGPLAFHMFPGDKVDETGWAGRRFNNLLEVYNALVLARACGRLVTLPRTLNPDSSSGGGGGSSGIAGTGSATSSGTSGAGESLLSSPTSLIDCVDFRQAIPFDGMEELASDVRKKFCNVGQLRGKTSRQVSQFYRNRRDNFPVQNTSPFDDVRAVAKRVILAYWGMRPNTYRCATCSDDPKHRVVAHVRSGDIFVAGGTTQHAHKGQPPLEFYVKAIRHSGATDVTIVSEDWNNPVLAALRDYDWSSSGGSDGDKRRKVVRLHFRVGENYEDDLHLLFCAQVVIFGNTSMGVTLAFSPNLESAYVGRLVDIERSVPPPTNEHERDDPTVSTVDDEQPVIPCEHCEMIDEPWVQPLLERIVRAKVFGYVAHRDYGPYQEWTGHGGQLGQMVSYANGSLVSLN